MEIVTLTRTFEPKVTYLTGLSSGLDEAVEWLKNRAVELFRNGKDEEATKLRRLADEMKAALLPNMEKRASRHAKEFPALLAEAEDE